MGMDATARLILGMKIPRLEGGDSEDEFFEGREDLESKFPVELMSTYYDYWDEEYDIVFEKSFNADWGDYQVITSDDLKVTLEDLQVLQNVAEYLKTEFKTPEWMLIAYYW